MKTFIMLTLLVLMAVPLGAQASSSPESSLLKALQPGEWHTKTIMTMHSSDKKSSVSPMTVTNVKCYKKADLHKLLIKFNINLPKLASCKQVAKRHSGNSSSVTENCSAQKENERISCKVRQKFSGIVYTVNMKCDSAKGKQTTRDVMQMHSSYTIESGAALRGHLDVRGKGHDKTVHMTMRKWAWRVGDCPAHTDK